MSATIRASSHARRPLAEVAFLLLALLPIIAIGVIALVSVDELREANARVERALQTMLLLKQIEDLVQDSTSRPAPVSPVRRPAPSRLLPRGAAGTAGNTVATARL